MNEMETMRQEHLTKVALKDTHTVNFVKKDSTAVTSFITIVDKLTNDALYVIEATILRTSNII